MSVDARLSRPLRFPAHSGPHPTLRKIPNFKNRPDGSRIGRRLTMRSAGSLHVRVYPLAVFRRWSGQVSTFLPHLVIPWYAVSQSRAEWIITTVWPAHLKPNLQRLLHASGCPSLPRAEKLTRQLSRCWVMSVRCVDIFCLSNSRRFDSLLAAANKVASLGSNRKFNHPTE